MFETEDLGAVHEAHAPLWTHSRRPQWGVGLLTAAGDGRRRLQFQDGRIRTFKEGFCHLLEPFDGSETAAAVVQEELERKHRTPQTHGCIKPRALRKQARVLGTDALVRRLPSPLGYAAARRVNGELASALADAGLQPRDSFDLRAFAWETLRPRGIARLAELNARGRLR
jgi:hypothetical protein